MFSNRISLARLSWLLALPLFVFILFFPHYTVQAANKVVGNGTAASCNDATLRNAVTGGGNITFNCGGAVTIPITAGQIRINYPTTIDGGDLITISGGNAHRIFYIFYQKSLTVRNITLRDGNVVSDVQIPDGGSAIKGDGLTSLGVYNSRFYNNNFTATVHGGEDESAYGGAIFMLDGLMTVENSVFTDNNSYRAGGAGIHTIEVNLTVRNSYFANNRSTGRGSGAAIYNDNVKDANGFVLVEGSTFVNNTSTGEGGAILTQLFRGNQRGTYNRNVFINNSATFDPDALSNGGAIRVGDGTFIISNSLFDGNTTEGQGGAIWVGETSSVQIFNNSIVNNRTSPGNTYGGGISLNGYGGSYYEIANNTISNNQAGFAGGGVHYNGVGQLNIINNTIMDNYAGLQGGGLAGGGSNVTFQNTIIAHNVAGNGSNNTNNCDAFNHTNGGNNLQYSNAIGQACAFGIAMNADPKVAALADNGGPYTTRALMAGSPAIDGGNSGVCAGGLINGRDQRGMPRATGPACDIGAFEVIAAPTVSLGFAASPVRINQNVRLNYTIANPHSVPLNNVAFSHSLPSGLKIASTPGLSNSCSVPGTVSAPANGTGLSVSGMGLPPYQVCTISVQLTSALPATYNTATSAITTKETRPGSVSNTASILIQAYPPSTSLSFTPNLIAAGGTSALKITLTNPNAVALSGIALTQALPTALKVVSAPATACGGTVTAVAGSSQVQITGASLSASQSCNFNVQVTSITPGSWVAIAAAPTATQSGVGTTGAAAVLEVAVPLYYAAPINSGNIFRMGATKPNTELVSGFSVRNAAPSVTTLNVSLVSGPGAPFNVSGLPLTLTGGTSSVVNVACTPTRTGTFTDTLTLQTNDKNVPGTLFTYELVCSGGYLITKNVDDGTDGTLSDALNNKAILPGDAIVFDLTEGNVITFTNPLTLTLKPGVTLDGGCNGEPGVVLDGTGIGGNGLTLSSANFLRGLQIHKFGGQQLVNGGYNNAVRCVVTRKN